MGEENTEQTVEIQNQQVQEPQPPQDPEPTEEKKEEKEITEEDKADGLQEQKEELKEEEKPKEELNEKLETIGFDLKTLEEEYFNNNGALKEETIAALNKVGFTNEFIDSFIEGRKAIYEQELNELATVVGGRENYNNIIEWSAKNLDTNVIASINQVRDKNILNLILPTLQTKMQEKEGVLPTTTLQGTAKVSSADIFESKAQMYEAIRDARYLKDEAYQEKVTRKIRASREAGIDLGI